MTSPRQASANRANAQKSTGPRSAAGRRVASQNARSHGLSVTLPQEQTAPLQAELLRMMEQDGLPLAFAHELASRIIEYERTLAHERQTFRELEGSEPHGTLAAGQEAEAKSVDPELQWLDDAIEDLRYFGGKEARKEIAEGVRLRERYARKLAIWEARARIKQEASALRYRKRAASQLIKALRSLT